MNDEILNLIPDEIKNLKLLENIKQFRPCQEMSIQKGLFSNSNNQLICSPTGSGKTLVAEFAILKTILIDKKKATIIVPLKALANQFYREFNLKYSKLFKIEMATDDIENEKYNYKCDLLILTCEKFDSLIRHNLKFISEISLLIIDEIHLLTDETRGPTLEIILSLILTKFKNLRIIGLSATIGNPEELAKWLCCDLIKDNFRPTILEHHILHNNNLMKFK